MFWRGEYAKRKFILKVEQDDKLEQDVYSLKMRFEELIAAMYPSCSWPCQVCPFDRVSSFSASCDSLWVKEGLGCVDKSCLFARSLTQLVCWNLNRIPGQYLRPSGFEYLNDEEIERCVEISSTFGLCIHEMFFRATSYRLDEYLKEHGRYPERNSLIELDVAKDFGKDRSIISLFSRHLKILKESVVEGNSFEITEARKVGLFFWDLKSLTAEYKDASIASLVGLLLRESWYKWGGFWRKHEHYFDDELSNKLSKKEIDDEYRKYYWLAQECINHQQLLSIDKAVNLVNTGKNKESDV